jgi:hypothetical protein
MKILLWLNNQKYKDVVPHFGAPIIKKFGFFMLSISELTNLTPRSLLELPPNEVIK